MADLILHNYQNSPFAEKARLMLGYKKLAWKSVTVPNIMPKPDVVALTGGYRRTPVLQIGADIYCDTALIADVLERVAPTPTFYPPACEGAARIFAQWADFNFFWAGIAYTFQPAGMANIFAGVAPEQMKAFASDRVGFRSMIPRMSFPDALGHVTEMVRRVEAMLASGQPFLFGDAASIADFSLYHSIWFMREVGKVPAVLEQAPRLTAWFGRMLAFGHGERSDFKAADAIALAHASRPADLAGRPFIDMHGIALGTTVSICAGDYGMEPVQGELVLADANELALRRTDDKAGEVVVHFPRIGFHMKKVET